MEDALYPTLSKNEERNEREGNKARVLPQLRPLVRCASVTELMPLPGERTPRVYVQQVRAGVQALRTAEIRKPMNVYHPEPRFDCANFAPCGRVSLSKCRRYKGRLAECQGCTMVKRKAKTLSHREDSRRTCTHCGRPLPMHRFYERTIIRGEKTYKCLSSWCKMCLSEYGKNRYKEKKNE